MSLTPLTEKQKSLIVANVVKSVKDINKLNNTGYTFLYLCSGFIAHYNLHGFKGAYNSTGKLKRDLMNNLQQNQWRNFRPGEHNYEYYMSKADVYNRIISQI